MKPSIATLILAAGAATRFKGIKQLAVLNDKPLLQQAIDTASQVTPGAIYVVLGAHHQRIAAQVRGATLVINHHWQQGLGSSLAVGVGTIASRHTAILVQLADQPGVSASALQTLVKAHTGDNIVCAHYAGRRGVPALFPPCCYRALQQIKGDCGARSLLQHTRLPVVELPLPDAALDIDTPDHYRAAQARQQTTATRSHHATNPDY